VSRPTLIKLARLGVAVGAAAVLVWIGRRNASDLGHIHLRLRVGWLVLSLLPYALSSLCLAVGWRAQLSAFGHRLHLGVAIRVWWRAQVARYVPTGLAAFASRGALARQEGVPASLGAASLAIELAALIGWGSLAAAVGLPSSLLSTPLRLVLGVGAASALVGLPILYPQAARLGGRIPALSTLSSMTADRVGLYRSLGWYGLSVAIKSIAFIGFAAALVSVHTGDFWMLSGAIQGAAVIGIIGITPAGIGIRETAMIGMLSPRFGTTDAAAIAVAWRAYEFVFELGWLAIGTVTGRRRTPSVAS
jgi:uncharacterized membrane protein YbhN (UPF0104 family)